MPSSMRTLRTETVKLLKTAKISIMTSSPKKLINLRSRKRNSIGPGLSPLNEKRTVPFLLPGLNAPVRRFL